MSEVMTPEEMERRADELVQQTNLIIKQCAICANLIQSIDTVKELAAK